MPADLSTIHIDRALASLSLQIFNEDTAFALLNAAARRPVGQGAISGKYYVYGKEQLRRSDKGVQAKALMSTRVAGAEAAELNYTIANQGYNCTMVSLRDYVDDDEILRSDAPLAPILDAGRFLTQRIRNDQEFLFARLAAVSGNYAAANIVTLTTGANGTSWAQASYGGTGTNPLGAIQTGRLTLKKIIGRDPNTLLLSYNAALLLADHPAVKNIVQYTHPEYLGLPFALPNPFRGLNVVVAGSIYDTAAEGGAFAGDFMFREQTTGQALAVICYVPPAAEAGPRSMSSFLYFDAPDKTTGQHGVSLRSYRDEKRGGFIVEASATQDVQAGIIDGSSKIIGAYAIFSVDI